MQRRTFLQHAGAGAAAGALATPVRAQGFPEIRWRLQSDFPKHLDLLHGGALAMADRVAALTGGKFRIQVLAREEAVSAAHLVDAVRDATVEACHAEANVLFDRDPVFAFLGAIPFGMTPRQQDAWLYHGGGLPLLRGALRRHNVIAFPAGGTGVQMGGWFRREVKSVADLKGLKMRSRGLVAAMLGKLGVVPQSPADRDLQAALQAGRIDAIEWVGPHDDEKQGFYKVAKYYYYPVGTGNGSQLCAVVNLDAWSALPKEYQSAFEAACVAAGVDLRAKYDALNPRALRLLLANGVQLRPFPPEVVKAAFLAAEEVVAELLDGNDGFRQIYSGWKSFRDEQIRAFGLAESRAQAFMHSAVVAQVAAAGK